MASATHSGTVKFIFEGNTKALVEETISGDSAANRHTVVNADVSSKAIAQTISYVYNAISALNDGRDVTLI